VCNQSSSEFRVIVVCHERPKVQFHHPSITYVEVDFAIPVPRDDTDMESKDTDKSRKIWTGLVHAQQFNPSHIMFVDADDCVSKHLAEFISKNTRHAGWFISKGYQYRDGSNTVISRNSNFHRKCGTSHIVRFDILKSIMKDIQFNEIKGWNFLYHQEINNMVLEKGETLEPLPFKGAIQTINNGENICNQENILIEMLGANPKKMLFYYLRKIGKLLISRPLTEHLRQEFTLYKV